MQRTLPIHEATATLPDLIAQAQPGDEIVLTDAGRPVARLVPIPSPPQNRIPGLNRGEVWVSDDGDAPLPDDFWMGDA